MYRNYINEGDKKRDKIDRIKIRITIKTVKYLN